MVLFYKVQRVALLVICTGVSGLRAVGESKVDFARDVLPILSDACFQCHGPDAKEGRKGDLRLDVEEDLKRARDGYHIVVAGDSAASELFKRVTDPDPDERMPPAKLGRPLSEAQVTTLGRWIEQGAEWGKHWAFERVERPKILRKGHPIDELVSRVHTAQQLTPKGRATRESLIRRLSLDLTGLPPTPEQVAEFLADKKPGAWQRLVDRTLASSAYGERMAFDWLDAARYADTNGYQGDRERTMWPWRDWVIKAFNQNMSYDRFTIWQLAGDLLPDASEEQVLATGFNRNHMINGEGGRIAEENRVEYVFDMTETMGTVWLGLTLNCCRCHDHKFDPLTNQEYYQFTAFFNQTPVNGAGGDPATAPVIQVGSAEQNQAIEKLQQEIQAVEARIAAHQKQQADKQAAWEAKQLAGAEKPAWDLLIPSVASSANGQNVEILDGGLVYTSGPNPDKDTYVVELPLAGKKLTGIKLEAVRHASMTKGGLARSDSGNFVLTDYVVEVRSGDQSDKLSFASAEATFEQNNFKITNTYDNNPDSGWAVWNGKSIDRNHAAVFRLKEPRDIASGDSLKVTLKFNSRYKHHQMGHFRLWASDVANPVLKQDDALKLALSVPADKRSKQQRQTVSDAFTAGDKELAALRKQVESRKKQISDRKKGLPKVMVMQDMPNKRKTYVLSVGAYNQQGEEVVAGVPKALPSLPDPKDANRLDLAEWLVHRDNPLTARVTVNRFWQMLFGIGLVKTSEDFGVQAEYPVQRELLDWLAVEFMESGWDVKGLLRKIVTSETYQRSSIIDSREVFERDPDNRLLARGPRFRLPSWIIRDQALAAAGLLNPHLGGPSVNSYQPEGIWSEATFGKKKYTEAKGDALYRRSLYTYWRRIIGPTMFFDNAKRQVCEVKPLRTNTPMHALNLFNSVTYVEAARTLAADVLKREAEKAARFRLAGQRVLGRELTSAEMAILDRSLARSLKRFEADPAAAEQFLSNGDSPRDEALAAPELAAWSAVCLNLLNLDETLNKE